MCFPPLYPPPPLSRALTLSSAGWLLPVPDESLLLVAAFSGAGDVAFSPIKAAAAVHEPETVLVVGGKGMVGTQVLTQLLQQGKKVRPPSSSAGQAREPANKET